MHAAGAWFANRFIRHLHGRGVTAAPRAYRVTTYRGTTRGWVPATASAPTDAASAERLARLLRAVRGDRYMFRVDAA